MTDYRTSPDGEGARVSAKAAGATGGLTITAGSFFSSGSAYVAPEEAPALVAHLAAQLTDDARDQLLRALAARHGDVLVKSADASRAANALIGTKSGPAMYRALVGRLRAAVEAARPVPHTREQDR